MVDEDENAFQVKKDQDGSKKRFKELQDMLIDSLKDVPQLSLSGHQNEGGVADRSFQDQYL